MISDSTRFSPKTKTTASHAWSAVAAMTLCVALLIASEFMPVSLLTPIASDLHASEGQAGQAISISGLFAVVTSILIANVAGRFNRRAILVALTLVLLASLALIAAAPNFAVLMAARALLGITVGGFWALATATIMRLVPEQSVPKALGVLYTGNAVATAFAAPLGSYLGNVIGWRGVFWALTPLVLINVLWQWFSLPSIPPERPIPVTKVLRLLKRRSVALAMVGVMLTFGGAFSMFTYFRPFLENYTRVSVPQLSLLLLVLGVAAFFGTYAASAFVSRHLTRLLIGLPVLLAFVSLGLFALGHSVIGVAAMLFLWGAINAAIPIAWATWISQGVRDEPEAGGGLMVAAIQLAIMLGASLGGLLLDRISIGGTFGGGVVLLGAAALVLGYARQTARRHHHAAPNDEAENALVPAEP
jgi:predicted MFS family arabinose efflux permease